MSDKITQEDRIPLGQKLAFAAGMNTEYIATGLMTGVLWMPFFNIGLGMSPVVLGGVLMILRAWDAFTDPLMGNLSDNTRTRWGRRRPYLVAGAVCTALLYPLIWYLPAEYSEQAKATYLTVGGMLFFAAFTLWSIPYYGMQLELTPSYDERTRLTGWMTFFSKLSYLAGGWLLALVILVGMLATGDPAALEGKAPWLRDLLGAIQPALASLSGAEPGEKPIVAGMRLVCWAIAAGILVFGLLPALFVKERYYEAEASRQERESFWGSLRESLRSPPLWLLNVLVFFLLLGTASVASLGQYLNFYYACGGDLALGALIAGWKGTVVVFFGVVTIPFFVWLGERRDKRTVVFLMLGCSMLGHLLNFALMTPANPWLQIIPGAFESCSLSAVWIFLPSMKADVADWDELRTRRRREGSINACHYWFIKAALTLSMGIGGTVLQISGFDASLATQPADALGRMFATYLFLPIALWGVALIAVWFYPLDRARSAGIRAELEARRGKI